MPTVDDSIIYFRYVTAHMLEMKDLHACSVYIFTILAMLRASTPEKVAVSYLLSRLNSIYINETSNYHRLNKFPSTSTAVSK